MSIEKQEEKSKEIRETNFFKKHKKGLIIITIILIIIIGVSSCVAKQVKTIQEAFTTQYATTILEKRNIINSVSVNGTISSDQKKEVTIPLTNIEIQEINIKVGDVVSKGDILAVLNSIAIEKNLEQAKQALKVANSQTNSSINSASKGLENTNESATINEARAKESKQGAYGDYSVAGAEETAALTEYNTAVVATSAAKTLYDKNVAESKTAQLAYDRALLNAGVDMNTFKEILKTVKDADKVAPFVYAWDTVGIETDLTGVVKPDINDIEDLEKPLIAPWTEGKTDLNEAKNSRDNINDKIRDLENVILAADYKNKIELPAVKSAQQVLTIANTNEAAAKVTYETKKAISDQKEIVYKTAKATREANAKMYNNSAQSLDDMKRANDATIDSQKSSLDGTKMASTTATTLQENQVEMYEDQLKECIVTIPFDGTITAINFEEGDTYSGLPLYTIQNCEALIISASVDQYDISDVEEGMRVVFKTDTTGAEEMIGIITFVSPVPEMNIGMSTGTNYPIEITIEHPNKRLRLGMTAQANIVLEEVKDVFAVPYECIKTDVDGKEYINVIIEEKNNKKKKEKTSLESMEGLEIINQNTKKIFVETGLETDYYTEISSPELVEGMVIQLSYLDNTLMDAMNGMTIGIQE